jgi:hypothetical protein
VFLALMRTSLYCPWLNFKGQANRLRQLAKAGISNFRRSSYLPKTIKIEDNTTTTSLIFLDACFVAPLVAAASAPAPSLLTRSFDQFLREQQQAARQQRQLPSRRTLEQ